MKRILLDLRSVNEPEGAGLARYASSLAPLLLDRRDTDYRFIGTRAARCTERFGDRRLDIDLPENDEGAAKLLALVCHLEQADLLFSPYHPVPERRTCRAVLMIHDLLPLRHPDWFGPRTREFFDGPLRHSARRATRILVNSEWTKSEVAEHYGIAEGRIAVVPLAAAACFSRTADCTEQADGQALEALGVRRPYVLVAATLEPRKNIRGIREAYPLIRRQLDVGLVIAGRYGWRAGDVLEPLVCGPFRRDVAVTGHVTDDQLALLYRNAEVFLYPSFLEGFGLPVLEAMASGAPVVTTAGGALPEVAGPSAAYCDPDEPASIAHAVVAILSNRAYRDNLVAGGYARARAFSWQTTADRTHEQLIACLED